jgi:hypothetical protein
MHLKMSDLENVVTDHTIDVSHFAWWYRERGYPMNPALMKRVYHTDVSTSTLIWEEGPFLVEMYLMRPNAQVVQHSHPFENCVIFLNGSMRGRREDGTGEPQWLEAKFAECISPTLPAYKWHSFEVGADGCVLLNFSKWANLEDKESATIKYIGDPLGPIHAGQLAAARTA